MKNTFGRHSGYLWLMAVVVFSHPALGANLQRVHDRLHPVIAQLTPKGRLDESKHLQLAISLPLRNQKALSEFLSQLRDPKSPNYRKYLTPRQFTERFGPRENDYETVEAFARAHGLRVNAKHPNRLILDVDGSVAAIEQALHVTIRTYRHPEQARDFYAADREPTLNLQTPIAEISGLNNYSLPHPRLIVNQKGTAQNAQNRPNLGTAPNGCYMGNDFRTAYVPGTSLTGTGQTVGLLEFDGYTTSDITYYESVASRPNVPLTNVLLDGFSGAPTGNGGEVEVSLDIEMAISMAPNVSGIDVYEAGPDGNWHDILNRMATDDLAEQLSCSWYEPDGPADPTADAIFQEMAAQGQSFLSASGDYDAYAGLISFPGDSPYITQVGGTTLTTNGAGGAYTSETVWNWGDGVGSGGGVSTQYAIPRWQQGVSMKANQGSTKMRNTPDVAMVANNVYVRADGLDDNIGGTSCAAPLWAAYMALVNQQAAANKQGAIGFVNPAVYALGQEPGYTTEFNDVTTGNNFSSSSPSLYSAVAGYDLCTGLGTPAGTQLIDALAGPQDILELADILFSAVGTPGGPFGPAAVTYTLTNSGTNTISWTAGAPQAWLSLSATSGSLGRGGTVMVTGSLNSTAAGLPAGNYSQYITFKDLKTGVQQYRLATLDISPPDPALTVSPSTNFTPSGQAGGPWTPATMTYTIINTGNVPVPWAAGNLSNWMTLAPTSGTLGISGSAAITVSVTSNANSLPVGSYSDTITVANLSNGQGSTTRAATLSVLPPPPVVTSGTTATALEGNSFSYQITASNSPTSFGASGLPAGLSVNASTGIVSGTALTAGTSTFTITAGNTGGTGTAAVLLTVNPAPPVITSGTLATGYLDTEFSYTISALNNPTSFSATGLPSGLSVDTATGIISGTATTTGTTVATITASNAVGTGTAALQIMILESDFNNTANWPTFGNGPSHTGYQPLNLGTGGYAAGWTMSYSPGTQLNPVAVSEGMVFVTPTAYFESAFLSALRVSDGTEMWRYQFGDTSSNNPPTVDSGSVYVQQIDEDEDANLWCLNVASGSLEWEAPFESQWASFMAPAVFQNQVWIDGGEYGGMYGFNTSNGSQLFFDSDDTGSDGWTPAYASGTVYSWVEGVFTARNPATGVANWSLNLGWNWDGYTQGGTTAISQGYAYVVGSPNLYGINLSTGTAAWTVSDSFTGTPAVANGVVYAISSGSVIAYDAQTGAWLESFVTPDTGLSGQPVVTLDTLIASSSSKTYLFNLQTHALEQTLPNGGPVSLANSVIYLAGSDGVVRTYVPGVALGVAVELPAAVSKSAGIVTGTLSANPVPATNLTVSLASSNTARATVPASVTIPAGQDQVTFPITIINDSELDGSQSVTISSAVYGYTDSSATMIINDSDTAVLTVSAPSVATKGDPPVQGTVTISAVPASNVTINLMTSNTAAATVPATMMIPAGETSGTFPITIVNNDRVDGGQTATITAQEANWTSGTSTITVNDNVQLAMLLPGSVSEGAGIVSGTVQAAGVLTNSTVVSLTSSLPARVSVPASVTIPAGASSVAFPVTLIDNGIPSGTQLAAISASAQGFTSATGTLTVLDDNPAEFTFSSITSPQSAAIPIGVTITARDASYQVVTGFVGTVNLSVNSGFAVAPAVSGSFTNGVWSGAVTVYNTGTGAVLTATDAAGATGQSNAFNLAGSDYSYPVNWPTFGNGPTHTGFQRTTLGTYSFTPGWTKSYGSGDSLNPVAVGEGMVYVTPSAWFSDGYISALNVTTGTEAWRYDFGASSSNNPPTVDAGQVYVQQIDESENGRLWCLNAASGLPVWASSFSAQWYNYYAPTVYQSGVWVNGGVYGGMYGYNTTSGSELFSEADETNFDEWTPTYYNGTIYSWVAGVFAAWNPTTGAKLWSLNIGWTWDAYSMNTVPAADQGNAYIVGNPNLYAVNLTTGEVAWTVNGSFTGSPATANGIVYAISSGNVNAYNGQSGTLLGTYSTGDMGISGQPIVTLDGLIVSSSSSTYLFSLSNYALTQTLPAGGPASLANGVIYLAGNDGTLRTFVSNTTSGLQLALPASVPANSGVVTGTATLNPIPMTSETVSLASSNTALATTPASVTIPAGSASATFQVTVIDGPQPNGAQQVSISGSASGLPPGSANILITPVTPVIGSATAANGMVGTAFSYQISASNYPLGYAAEGLPDGLSVNASTGLISGTPSASGTFPALISAINASGTGSAGLMLNILPQPPVITSPLTAIGFEGLAFTYNIAGTNNPAGFGASGLPPGLSIDTSTGVITGTPTASGSFMATVSAINTGGTGSALVTMNILGLLQPPDIASPATASGVAGTAFFYQIAADNYPTGFGANGLPTGLAVNASTGAISGTPVETGTFAATITANNLAGTGTGSLLITILPQLPVITSGSTARGATGFPFTYQIEASNGPASFGAVTLPPGLSVDESTGLVSGTPADTGTFVATIDATNAMGSGFGMLSIVIDRGFAGIKGSYAGLGAVGGTNAALFRAAITSRGAFTASLTLPGTRKYSWSGKFSPEGMFVGTARSLDARLDMALAATPAGPAVDGTIGLVTATGTESYSVESSLLGVFNARTIPAGLKGRYSVILPAMSGTDGTTPNAPGYATMTVETNGVVHISGKLGDGSGFDTSGQLHADGKTWTLFESLYAGRYPGSIAGENVFETDADSDCDGCLQWIKPQQPGRWYASGFSMTTKMMAAKYTAPPLASGTAAFTLGGGNLPADAITDSLAVSPRDQVILIGNVSGGLTLTLTPATGLFKGTFLYPGTNTRTTFSGMIYQKPLPGGFGLFKGTNEYGSVQISQ